MLVSSNKYTLDRFEGIYAIFLLRPYETNQLIIEKNELGVELEEGDIVEITDTGYGYHIVKLSTETAVTEQRMQGLLEKLRNKNKYAF